MALQPKQKVIEWLLGRSTSVEVTMVGLGRLAFLAVIFTVATCLTSQRQANAATVNVIAELDLNGQTFALTSGQTLNFDISGPIAGSIQDGFVVRVGISGAPTVTTSEIIINSAPFISAQVSATVNGSTAGAGTNNCSNCGVTQSYRRILVTEGVRRQRLELAI
jgi:hypothetical protein